MKLTHLSLNKLKDRKGYENITVISWIAVVFTLFWTLFWLKNIQKASDSLKDWLKIWNDRR